MIHLDIETINSLIESQLEAWPESKQNFDRLKLVRRKNISLGDFDCSVQYNPGRVRSTGADISKEAIEKRPCFLCAHARPAEQFALDWLDGWQLLVNPFPILPVHFTIVSTSHRPQEKVPYELASMAEKAPDLVVFFNGSKAGASAPDHMHVQAVLKSELPIVSLAEKIHPAGGAPIMRSDESSLDLPFLFYSAIIAPNEEGMKTLASICNICGFDKEGNRDQGLVNTFFWMGSEGLLRCVAVPRKAHRPRCFTTDTSQNGYMISPGAIDMGGIIITPRLEDFEKSEAEDIAGIYADVAYLPLPKKEPQLRVGLVTEGEAIITENPQGTSVDNLIIGKGFHWEHHARGAFAGKVIPASLEESIGAINEIGLEEYLQSVIASEMNPNAPIEFLKAHAIISRTWALRKIMEKSKDALSEGKINSTDRIIDWEESDSHLHFDICNEDHCQRYHGKPAEGHQSAKAAIEATRGVILLDPSEFGAPADARFSKCCGGKTEIFSSCWGDHDKSYLISQEDPWCDLKKMPDPERTALLSSCFKSYDAETESGEWTAFISEPDLRSRLNARHGVDIGMIEDIRIVKRGASGRAIELEVLGDRGHFSIGKELAIRRLLAADCLKSSWIDLEPTSGGWTIHGRGWGHGVGLCQTGAAAMAFQGRNAREILDFYFPNIEIIKLYD